MEELKIQFQKICDIADASNEEPWVACLTAQKRTLWAKQRELLAKRNKDALQKIESAMFMVSLDSRIPKDFSEHAKMCLVGAGNDRWFDKNFTTVTYGNSYGGMNVEHSAIDALVFGTMAEYSMSNETYENGDVVKDPRYPPRDLGTPQRLHWDITGLETQISEAKASFMQLSDNLDIQAVHSAYGKGFMKKVKLSPDGYIQMALQLAYYRIHKEIPKTYEPSTSRLFALGRTETVHPGSVSSNAWVKAMDDKTADKATTIDLLRKAVKYQTTFRLETTIGKGCDRHLLGLLCASREMGMDLPRIFRDKAWQMPFKLSTSQTPTYIWEYGADMDYKSCAGGFGPGTADGYGVSYIILGNDHLVIHVASWNDCPETSSAVFGEKLHEALADMKELMSK